MVLAVCAGFQVVGRSFPGRRRARRTRASGSSTIDTVKVPGPRAVGEVVAEPSSRPGGLPSLTGFENHGGVTTLDGGHDAARPGTAGIGNGDGSEGALAGPSRRDVPARPGAGAQPRAGRPPVVVGARRRSAGAARRGRPRACARNGSGQRAPGVSGVAGPPDSAQSAARARRRFPVRSHRRSGGQFTLGSVAHQTVSGELPLCGISSN